MTVRLTRTTRFARIAAVAAIGAGALTAGGAATAQAASTTSGPTYSKGTAFVTPDGKLACAYDERSHHTVCMNMTKGWLHTPGATKLTDVDGHQIADHPFRLPVDAKKGVGRATVTTQCPTFHTVKAQGWHKAKDGVKHVRIATDGYGDYVNQDFAVAKPGTNIVFPDGLNLTVEKNEVYHDYFVTVTSHPTKGSFYFETITTGGYGTSDN